MSITEAVYILCIVLVGISLAHAFFFTIEELLRWLEERQQRRRYRREEN